MFKRLKKLKWLGLGIVVVGLALGWSVRSYITSQNRQDISIFEARSCTATATSVYTGECSDSKMKVNENWSACEGGNSGSPWDYSRVRTCYEIYHPEKPLVSEFNKCDMVCTGGESSSPDPTDSDSGTGNGEFVSVKDGELRIYFYTLLDTGDIKVKITKGGEEQIFPIHFNEWVDTGIELKDGDRFDLMGYDKIKTEWKEMYGWIKPTNNKCMETNIKSRVDNVLSAGEPLISTQCWADSDTGTNQENKDYDDWLIVLSYAGADPDNFTSPKPSATPGVGGVTSPSPGSTTASFVIHKFLDTNRNGVRETGEDATERAWTFEYQINGGSKKEYVVEPGDEKGAVIEVNKSDVVKVSEQGQEGWLNTTGAEVTKTISEDKQYVFYFGNVPVGGSAGGATSFPPTQPDTGTPTWLTLGAVGLVVSLLLVKKYGFR